MCESRNETAHPTETLLRVPQVAETLAVKPIVAYRLIWDGELPAVKFRRSVRVRPADLALFIQNHRTGKVLEVI